MIKSKSLIFFGTETFSLSALISLVENGFNVVAVVTKPDSRKGRSKELIPSSVKQYALAHDLPVIQLSNSADIEKELEQYDAFAGVLSSFGKIIPSSTLAMFEGGIVNVHPSLLPKYRGASPIEQAILSGDSETGVSLMKLVDKMDAGPVYAQQTVALEGKETSPDLYKSLAEVGSNLLVDSLPTILSGELVPTEQIESQVSFAPMITKQDGVIDWNQPANNIEREIRAYLDWPGSKAVISDAEITVLRATIVDEHGAVGSAVGRGDAVLVYCKEKALAVRELKPTGKRAMSAKEYLAGNKVI